MLTPKFNIGDVVKTKDERWVISSIKMIELVEDGEIKYRIGGPNLYKGRELELYQKSPPSIPETPIENKQDFGEAIKIVNLLYSIIVELGDGKRIMKYEMKIDVLKQYQKLLNILSSK